MPKDKLDLFNLSNYVPLKVIEFDSNQFLTIQDIDGEQTTILNVEKKDREDAFKDLILWHLTKAKEDICATADDPTNDTRYINGHRVIKAIQAAIDISNEERKFTAK